MLSIKDGRVLLQIGYREDLKLEIKSTNRYTNGNWTHIEVGRQYDRKKKIEKGKYFEANKPFKINCILSARGLLSQVY